MLIDELPIKILVCLLTFVAFPILNHIRGGAYGLERYIPGHPRYMVSVVIALVGCLVMQWQTAVAFAGGYLLWSLPGWGRWFTLGRKDRTLSSGPAVWYERWIEALGLDDYWCFAIRNAITLLPLGLYLFPWFIAPWFAAALGWLIVLCYHLGWKWDEAGGDDGITNSEYIVGALWAGVFTFIALFQLPWSHT